MIKKYKKILIIIGGIAIFTMALIFAFLRSNEDTWVKDKNGNWVKHGNPTIYNFETCSQKYPTATIFPSTCSIPDGPTFTEESEKIVVYGDSRDGHEVHRQIVDAIVDYDPTYVFHVGDLVSDGSNADQWQTFNSIAVPIKSKLYPVLGNHENNDQKYYDNFNLPGNEEWYFIDTENIYFICIDSNKILDQNAEQLEWFKNQLSVAKNSGKFIAVIMHHPLYSSAKHQSDDNTIKLREILVPLIESANVDLVFAGHDHVYEQLRKGNIHYFTIGSAGAPLYPMAEKSPYSQIFESKYSFAEILSTADQVQIRIFDENKELIDDLELE